MSGATSGAAGGEAGTGGTSAPARPGVQPWRRGDEALITADAVALDLPSAGLGVRIGSGAIDLLCTLGVLLVSATVLTAATSGSDAALQAAAGVAITAITFVAYPAALETLTRGRSVGKLATGLRTVRDDAGPISFQHAFLRALIGFVEIYVTLGTAALVSALVSPRGKRIGDHFAGTYVVRDRVALELPYPPPMPPPLAAWARRADVAAPPAHLMVAVRRFLARAPSLAPPARAELGRELADRLTAHVAPLPPAGTPPEAFLCAVVAARRDRDLARLRREDALRRRLVGR